MKPYRFVGLMILGVGLCCILSETSHANCNPWSNAFAELKINQPRMDAERIVAKIRKIPSHYDLSAMDTHKMVVYRLDAGCWAVLSYKPGVPRAILAPMPGQTIHGRGAIDGTLLDYELVTEIQ